jgi:hypothetical protein
LASPETVDREFSALAMIKENFPKYVLSLGEFDLSRNGIRRLKIRGFLSLPEA